MISRLQPKRFYSLPHSPQLYKQHLLASYPGLKAYYQIASNFRPEVGDHVHGQEFHQIDFEVLGLSLEPVRKTVKELCTLAFSLIDVVPAIYDSLV